MAQTFDVAWLIFWTALPVLVLAQGSIVVAAIRARGQPGQTAGQRRGASRLDIFWAIVPAMLVAVLAALTYQAVQSGARGGP